MNKKPINDEQLDALLRQVDVPGDLKESLLKIPAVLVEQKKVEQQKPQDLAGVKRSVLPESIQPGSGDSYHVFRYLAIAAVIIGLIATLMWITNPSWNAIENAKAATNDLHSSTQKSTPNQPASHSNVAIESINESRRELESMLAEVQLRKLKSRLINYEPSTVRVSLDHNEFQSLVAVYTGQAISTFGGNAKLVREAMIDVQRTHPNTQGAEIAIQYLSQRKNQSDQGKTDDPL